MIPYHASAPMRYPKSLLSCMILNGPTSGGWGRERFSIWPLLLPQARTWNLCYRRNLHLAARVTRKRTCDGDGIVFTPNMDASTGHCMQTSDVGAFCPDNAWEAGPIRKCK